ncbi:hypothetical protein M0P65_07365, partial [Candidatus Gracilibacteria bacterium]|nr:hypothetical protein [Candidatus Gracilibacteria bacterium]
EKVTQLKEEIKKLVIKILNEEKEKTGLIVIGKTQIDNNRIKTLIANSDFYAEWDVGEGYWFFPEDEDTYDELEKQLTDLFDENDINARIEGIWLKKESITHDKIIKEDRLNPEEADYEINKKGIVVYLKKKKAENFTKLIKSLDEIELLQQQIDIKKKEIAEQSKEQDEKYEEKDEQLRQMVLGLFNAEELANTLYVDAAGSLLTLAKKTEKNEPSQITPLSVDYKKAWEAVTQLFTETNIGLVDQMKEVLNQFTVIGETYTKPGAKRKLRRGVKEESILKEVLNEFKFSDIWTNVKSFLNKFKSWGKVFKKKIDLTNQIINQL